MTADHPPQHPPQHPRRPRGRVLAAGLLALGVGAATVAGAVPAAAAQTFVVTTTADAGPGSLRQAITDANAASGADRITFALPGTARTIAVASPLPAITGPVAVDGYSQRGSSPNDRASGSNARPGVEISGGDRVVGNGLVLAAGSDASTVRGLAVNGFVGTTATSNGAGIRIESARSTIAGTFVGLGLDGETAKPNRAAGVLVTGADNRIGGPRSADRNVVSGNGAGLDLPTPSPVGTAGVSLRGRGATGNVVTNGVIGPSASGRQVLTGTGLVQGNGVIVELGAQRNVVGAAGRNDVGNVLSGNAQRGVWIQTPGTSFNTVTRNRIGTDLAGTGPLPGSQAPPAVQDSGIQISGDARYDTVGVSASNPDDPSFGNLFAFNDDDGVLIGGTGRAATDFTDGHLVRFNTYRDNGGQDRIGLANNGDAGTPAEPSPFEATPGLGTPPFDRNVTNLDEPLDADTGPNNENDLVLLDPTTRLENGRARARGRVSTEPNATFLLDFYANATPDPSGYGEGETYIGSGTVRTNALGDATIDVLLPADRAVRRGVTITANTTKLSGGATAVLPAGIGPLAGQLTQPPFSTGEFGRNSTVR